MPLALLIAAAPQQRPASAAPGLEPLQIRYTSDLTDQELRRRWLQDPAALGSISLGFVNRGRLINAVHMPEGDGWICEHDQLAWGAQETIDALVSVFTAMRKRFPGSARARLTQIGAREGGYQTPHRSHQSGRDADISFFYRRDIVPEPGSARERLIDPVRNWALLRTLITTTDVQLIVVDRAVQAMLRNHALKSGEDRAWVDRIFAGGVGGLVQHEQKHRDHFHVRFYAPRAAELGQRIQPLLPLRPEQNLAIHKIKRGQTLGSIARSYGTTIAAILKANHLDGARLLRGEQLLVPLRKPCVDCPQPPPVVVPPRCLPPEARPAVDVASVGAGQTGAMSR
jgi:murein endopeptidase